MLRGWQSAQVPGRSDRATGMRRPGLDPGPVVPASTRLDSLFVFPLDSRSEAGVSVVTKKALT